MRISKTLIVSVLAGLAVAALWLTLATGQARGSDDVVPRAEFGTCGPAEPFIENLKRDGWRLTGAGPALGWRAVARWDRESDGAYLHLVYPVEPAGMVCVAFIGKGWKSFEEGA